MYTRKKLVNKPFYEDSEEETEKARGSYYVPASLKEKVEKTVENNDNYKSNNQVVEQALKEFFSGASHEN